jgi:hypothetical protein
MHSFGVAILLLATLSPVGANDQIAITVRSSGAVLVPIAINGQGPFTFLLDTGSSHTIVTDELADRLRLPLRAKVPVSTAGGVQMQLVVGLEHTTIGNASVAGLLPSVVTVAQLRDIESGVDGVIGQDFLSAFNYTVDYRRSRLWWAVEPDEKGVRLPLIRAGERFLVQLAGNGRGNSVLMVPDSGSEAFVIFERSGQTAVAVDQLNDSVGISVLSSQRVGRGARLREFHVGAVTLRNQPAVVVQRSGSREMEGDGLMPLHRFSCVCFNNRDGYLIVRR